jgi:hypothetical protein
MTITGKVSLFLFGLTSSHGFLSVLHINTLSLQRMTTPITVRSSFLEQQPGESDIDFIKRMTSTPLDQKNNTAAKVANKKKIKGKYQRIEDWDSEREAKKGELSWEERVQFEGQRFGNQIRQNDILNRNLNGL